MRYLIENIQPAELKQVLADNTEMLGLFLPAMQTKGEVLLGYRSGQAYRTDIKLREDVIKNNVLFDFGESYLSSEAMRTLDSIARLELRYRLSLVDIIGHTDSIGSFESNQVLSERRAKSVADYLERRWSTESRPTRSNVAGRSFTEPVSDNVTNSGRATNRRANVNVYVRYLD
jgi:outer membrane protein OmpA-like peptidoglycan-associated protein